MNIKNGVERWKTRYGCGGLPRLQTEKCFGEYTMSIGDQNSKKACHPGERNQRYGGCTQPEIWNR